MPSQTSPIRQLARWLRESRFTAVLTGAGMSTESGIPDFRSRDGWWRRIDPRTVATVDALEANYDGFHDFYAARIRALTDVQPHRGHRILADWERRGLIRCIATQNVDGLHAAAGSGHIYELHGSIRRIRCSDCGRETDVNRFLEKQPCSRCGGKLRPGVVLFGEVLPELAWNAAFAAMKKAELVLVIGTRLEVYPVNQLPHLSPGKVAWINREIPEGQPGVDLVVQGKAGEILQQVDDALRSEREGER